MRIKMIALILGGGAGTRLFPLTKDRSKPAVPIGGKYRLIDIPISNCLNSGVSRMFVLTQYNSASLNQHIKNTYTFDNFSRGFVDILAAEQTPGNLTWFQGTADAVRQTMHHLRNHDFDYILILAGDQLYQMDFELLAKYHVAQNADLTIATIPVDDRDAPSFGIMKVNQYGFIERFIEKPKPDVLEDWKSDVSADLKAQGKHYLASMGIYIFNKGVIKKLFEKYPESDDFGKEIIPSAIKSGYNVASYEYNGYWEDVGKIRSFFDANIQLADEVPKFNLFDDSKKIYTRPRMLAPSKINGTTITRSVIAEGCFVFAKSIEKSIIGIRSRIGANTVIKECVIMGNDYFETLEKIVTQDDIHLGIGANCVLERTIVDKNCRIGNNVIIRGHESLKDTEEEAYQVKDGIVVIKKNARIEDNTKIGWSE